MTVGKLKQLLNDYPDEMDAYIQEPETGFEYSPVEHLSIKTINFKEEPDGRTLAKEKALVIETYQ